LEHNKLVGLSPLVRAGRQQPELALRRPSNPLITQYGSEIDNKVAQFYVQDEWRMRPDLVLQGGFKSSLQFADGQFPVQPKAGAIANGSLALPVGEIITKKWFLPQIGARWDITAQDQMFVNVQKNMRQFVTYGGGGASPWSLASQQAFDLFKANAKPETSVTYEAGPAHQPSTGPGRRDRLRRPGQSVPRRLQGPPADHQPERRSSPRSSAAIRCWPTSAASRPTASTCPARCTSAACSRSTTRCRTTARPTRTTT
jgi:hypothetical protein